MAKENDTVRGGARTMGRNRALDHSREASNRYVLSMATTSDATRVVPHLTVAERAARGKAARAEVPRSSHAVFEPAARRTDPVKLLERQAETRVPELVPIRYGRMLVSPFTFYRGAALIMASDLAATPRSGLHGAVLRRRAPVELRRVRLARATAGVRHQRLRRDAARAVGVGRQAPGREHADRRARQRLRRQGPGADRARHRRGVPHRDGALRRDEEPRRLVRAPGHRGRAARSSARSSTPKTVKRTEKDARQGAHQGQHVGVLETRRAWWTARRGSSPNRR